MRFVRTLVFTYVFTLLALGASARDPAVFLNAGAGRPVGQMVLEGQPHGGVLDRGTLRFDFDSGQVDTPTAADVALAPGWQGTLTRLGANSIRLDISNNAGQTTTGPVLAITFRHKQQGFHAATITLDGASNIDGEDSDGFPGPFGVSQQDAPFLYGTMRHFGEGITGTVAVGMDQGAPMAAMEAGGSVFVFNPADAAQADLPGWKGGAAVGGAVMDRPAFGEVSGALVVAAGTAEGHGIVRRVADGTLLSDADVGDSAPKTPAIAGNKGDVYWPVVTSNGPAIVHQRIGGGTDQAALGQPGDTIVSSPAIWNNMLVIGSQSKAFGFRTDPDTGVITPQAVGEVPGDMFSGAPVVVDGMAYSGGESGAVYRVNLQTGEAAGKAALPAGAAPLSNPFHDQVHKAVVFGGADGRLYRVSVTDLSVTNVAVSTMGLNDPVVIGADTYVSDIGGQVFRVNDGGQVSLSVGGAPSTAVSIAPGAPATLLINTSKGDVFALPLS